MPPRHGKTALVTIRYAAFRLERDPTLRIIIGAYNQDLAEFFSRQIRRIITDRGVALSPEMKNVGDWETAAGGGVKAAGVGSGVTGRGGDLIIIDDPIKSREEAESPAYRERCWNWYTNDIYTRLEPGGAIILIQTRWHDDDLAGRVQASESGQDFVNLTLAARALENDVLGRELDEPLWPDRYDGDALDDIEQTLGPYAFGALYQQTPHPREGGMFQKEWLQNRIINFGELPPMVALVRYWDKSGGTVKSDYTAGVLMGRGRDGRFYVIDVVRVRALPDVRRREMRAAAVRDGRRVKVWIESEGGSAGKESVASDVKALRGFSAFGDPATGSKEVRAEPFAAQCAVGNVFLVRAGWNDAYIDELAAFPRGRFDDQVDGSSGAFSKVELTFQRLPNVAGIHGRTRRSSVAVGSGH
jgi:predicted phage terminase large subunit-like protein